ncbi:uncharacterized protein LOC132261085 [Phlebotomus argentipes]|uniref:uncharacterized protein LOC132261085 n=1 Tax=Phlebotomus argentipes TaxID=94469 RepID=UPI002892F3FD|nr:uncharacterized protein LOC132261085 [Phlebotomus argentipes]
MKVDKAVCTSDVLEDLSRAIKFEAVFTTLVENKIVAIKRECEEKAQLKKAKKRRFALRRLFSKPAEADVEVGDAAEPEQEQVASVQEVKAEVNESDSPRTLNRPETEASGSGVELEQFDVVSIRSDMCRTGEAAAAVAEDGKLSQSDDVIFRTKPPRRQARARFKEDVVETTMEVKPAKAKRKYNLREASLLLEQERHRLRILEAKSISAQCSPILARHQPSDSPDLSLESRHSAPPAVAEAPRKVRHEASVNYQATNPLSQGFVSSFNQLTTSHLPVMATAKSKTPCDMIKMHRMSPGRARQDDAAESSLVGETVDEEAAKKKKSWHRIAHRLSDPVLVYPSTSGLQHCILSRPPNQPIDLPYDEDFIYDVSLQIDPERSGDVEAVIPGQRRHKHKHHKHCKKKRHKRRKILVHDIDEQIVKVIDPDDLPKRARWTIIATACLLLVMCLLLVGVTLRMAPIIDDMVRQENERLMQESLNRAKFAKNFTDAASLTAQEEIP